MTCEMRFISIALATCVTSPWLLLAVNELMGAEAGWMNELLATFFAAVSSFIFVFNETLSLYHLSAFSGLGTDLPQQVYVVVWEI